MLPTPQIYFICFKTSVFTDTYIAFGINKFPTGIDTITAAKVAIKKNCSVGILLNVISFKPTSTLFSEFTISPRPVVISNGNFRV